MNIPHSRKSTLIQQKCDNDGGTGGYCTAIHIVLSVMEEKKTALKIA